MLKVILSGSSRLVLAAGASLLLSLASASVSQAAPKVIKLPAPKIETAGMPVMEALSLRRSQRSYSANPLSEQQLSDLLWAADGIIKRPSERKSNEPLRKTAPSCFARYPIIVYAFLKEGVYRYESEKHELELVSDGDFRQNTGTQDFVGKAPLNLLYVADYNKFKGRPETRKDSSLEEQYISAASIEVGAKVQNVSLYCASTGLKSVVRQGFDKKKLSEAIKLRDGEGYIVAQTVGYADK